MTAIHLHFEAHVGTTYKRALTRKIPVRDRVMPNCPGNSTALRLALYYHDRIIAQWRLWMRRPRDFDSELKALADKARQLKERRVRQLGELVAATGADALDADLLAGVLLDAVAMKDAATKEGWRKRGAAFFQAKAPKPASGTQHQPSGTLPLDGSAASA
jgi:hypothetical protein